jgi:hypothetical protein
LAIWLGHAALAAPAPARQTYASAEQAATALADATRSDDAAAMQAIFGPGNEKLLSSGDRYADEEQQRRFAAAYDEKHALVPLSTGEMALEVGDNDWRLPIPIVLAHGRWHFDTAAGAQEIINRTIGHNELAAIRVALAYVAAQKNYFEQTKQATGVGSYADRLISTAGHHDGLYWPAAEGRSPSPFATVVAEADEEGYAGAFTGGEAIPCRGYYFRVLNTQGPNAPGGAANYVQSDRMRGGFALLAWPATYGSSGIMSLQVNQDDIVFQKDLGPDTAHFAAGITRFDADLTWARIEASEHPGMAEAAEPDPTK